MPESFTETTTISYGQNIKNSLSGVIFGVVLFLASFVVLWMNEGHNVAQLGKADYMNKNAVEISATKIDRGNDNKLVQVSGKAITTETLTDKIITVPNAFALSRKVEMYQWQENVKTEKKDNMGGSTTETKTYTYEKVWSDHEIDSSDFKKTSYSNPPFTIKSEEYYAKSGKLGDFELTSKQTESMHAYTQYENLPQKYEYKIHENTYYKGYDPQNPQIGDIRISYKYIPSDTGISIIGKQKSDNTLTTMPYKDSSVYLQQDGIKDKAEMLGDFRQSNKILTNVIRVLGWLMMFIGLNALINPLVVIFKVVPFVEKIIGSLTGGIVLLITLALSLLTIAIAWLAYRPVLSISLIVMIGCIAFLIKTKFAPAKQATQETENPEQ